MPLTTVDLKSALERAATIAVFGCSARPSQTSHAIARYLQHAGYRVVPVNPHHDELIGETCYPNLASIPEDVHVDIVNVFRRPQFTADAVRQTAERAERTGNAPVVWTQLGVSSAEAERTAEEADLPYIRNRCIKVEHQRLCR